MTKILVLMILVLVNVWGIEENKFYETSYNCSKTKVKSVEWLVCKDEELANLDVKLSTFYRQIKDKKALTYATQSMQSKWITTKNHCKTIECIKNAYNARNIELEVSLKNLSTFSHVMRSSIRFASKSKNSKITLSTFCNKTYTKRTVKRNDTLKVEYKNDKKSCNDFCGGFMNDLYQFKNVTVVKPLLNYVPYNDPRLKEALGACHQMRWDIDAYYYHPFNQRKLPYPQIIKEPKGREALMRLWNFKYEGKNRLLLAHYRGLKEVTSDFFVLDKEACKERVAKKGFDWLVDRKALEQIRLSRTANNLSFIEVVKSQNQSYILNVNDNYSRHSIGIFGKDKNENFYLCKQKIDKNKDRK